MKFSNLYTYFITKGVTSNNLSQENRRVKLLNSFCITWSATLVIFVILDSCLMENPWVSLFIHFCAFLCIVLVFFLQGRHWYNLARIVFLLSLITVTFLFANFFHRGHLMENAYYIYPLVALILFDKKSYSLIVMLLCFLLYYIPSRFFLVNYDDAVMKSPMIISLAFIGPFVILNYSQTLNKKSESELTKNKIALEKAYQDLEQTKENELSGLKLQSLRSQMNPHFIFNALNSIQDYIISNHKTLAGDYLGKFADLMRLYLNQSSKKEITLFEEVDTLERYLELEKLRFEEKLDCEIFVEDSIDRELIYVPTMLLQPHVENSLKHGLLHKQGKGKLIIKFTINTSKNLLICVISDDGIGREKSMEIQQRRNVSHQSFATKATKERLRLINQGRAREIHVCIEDLFSKGEKQNPGTKVTLQIPI